MLIPLDFCDIELYHSYVIITIHKDIDLCLTRASVIRELLQNHFGQTPFVMISNREYKHTVQPEVYRKGQLKNMKGLAIVSTQKTERDQALIDQKMFDKSFAFFHDMETAKSWASDYFL